MKVSFINIGCKVNFADVSSIASDFEHRGHQIVDFGEPADVVLINTCTVTKNADADCRKIIRRALRISPNAFIAVLGCYVQVNPDEVSSIEGVDAIFGTNDKFAILELIDNFEKRKTTEKFISSSEIPDFHGACSVDNEAHTRMALKIQDGCDYVCTYCIIPHARGNSRSMNFNELKTKIISLENSDFYEIVLSGINLGEYNTSTGENFTDILKFIDSLSTKMRYRISSIEPNLITDEMIDIVASSCKICPHFHIPLQSGSNTILKLMKRRYNVNLFETLIHKIKNKIPDCCIGVDLITGFPGEKDEQFDETYNLVQSLPISYLHVFTYSERAGTPAADFPDSVPHSIRKLRTQKLRELSEIKRNEFYLSQLNKIKTVIPEVFDENKQLWNGWTENYVRVHFEASKSLESKPLKIILNRLDGEFVDSIIHT